MRTRTRGSTFGVDTEFAYFKYSNRTYSIPSDPGPPRITRQTRSDEESISDVVTPGYFAKAKSGLSLPVNPLVMKSHKVIQDDADFHFRMNKVNPSGSQTGALGYLKGGYPAHNFNYQPVDQPPEVNTNHLLIEALSEANARSWDVLTFAAEYHKTVDLVKGAKGRIAQRSTKILDLMKKRRRKFAPTRRELLKEFSDMWLEARYGWRIMAYDVESAQDSYAQLSERSRQIIRRTAREETSSDEVEVFTDLDFGMVKCRTVYNATRKVRAGVGIEIILDAPISVDPIVTLHELTPWSFVADWMFNIGQNLTAFSPFANGSLEWGFISEEIEFSSVGSVETASYAAQNQLSGGIPWVPVFESRLTTKTRTPAHPTFDIGFRPNLNLGKGVDLLALASGIYTRKVRAINRMASRR